MVAQEDLDHYEREGWVALRGVLDADLMAEASAHVDWLVNKYPDIPPEHFHHIIMRNDPFWVRLISDDRLLDVAASMAPFLEDDVALFSSHYFAKMPHTGMPVLWHQDGSYWPLRPMNVVTMWLAIDRSDSENGCLRVIPGSHKEELTDLKESKDELNVLGSATHTDEQLDLDSVVDIVLNPGDVSLHHPNLIHGSNANTSDRRRCGLTARYISPDTQCTDPEQPVMLLRGKGTEGVNNYRSWPRYRPGYDMPFAGCEEWNDRRAIVSGDEAFFARTDFDNIEAKIRADLNDFIDFLGGRG